MFRFWFHNHPGIRETLEIPFVQKRIRSKSTEDHKEPTTVVVVRDGDRQIPEEAADIHRKRQRVSLED